MTSLEQLIKIFADTFQTTTDQITDDFSTDTVADWDSVTQLSLVTAVEDHFDIMLDTDDILDFKSFPKAKEIIAKHDIAL